MTIIAKYTLAKWAFTASFLMTASNERTDKQGTIEKEKKEGRECKKERKHKGRRRQGRKEEEEEEEEEERRRKKKRTDQ